MLLLLVLLLQTLSPTLKVSPRFAPEPATLTFTVGNAYGRRVCAEIDGPRYYTSSCQYPDGNKTIVQFVFPRVPAGTYEARAHVDAKATPVVEVVITATGENP